LAERRFVVIESDQFRRRVEQTIGRELWETRLRADIGEILAANPHRFPQLGVRDLYAVKLVTGHTIFYRIDFNHAEVTLQDIFGEG
jgi:hypothetical protein